MTGPGAGTRAVTGPATEGMGMSSNTREVDGTVDDVWSVLSDGWLYPLFVVGASRMREVDAGWPDVGPCSRPSRFGSLRPTNGSSRLRPQTNSVFAPARSGRACTIRSSGCRNIPAKPSRSFPGFRRGLGDDPLRGQPSQ